MIRLRALLLEKVNIEPENRPPKLPPEIRQFYQQHDQLYGKTGLFDPSERELLRMGSKINRLFLAILDYIKKHPRQFQSFTLAYMREKIDTVKQLLKETQKNMELSKTKQGHEADKLWYDVSVLYDVALNDIHTLIDAIATTYKT